MLLIAGRECSGRERAPLRCPTYTPMLMLLLAVLTLILPAYATGVSFVVVLLARVGAWAQLSESIC